MLPVKQVMSGGVLGSETSFSCFASSLSSKSTCTSAALMCTECEINKMARKTVSNKHAGGG